MKKASTFGEKMRAKTAATSARSTISGTYAAASRTMSAPVLRKVPALIVSLMLALCVCLLCGCGSSEYAPEPSEKKVDDSLLHTPGTLRVGVDASNPPYAAESQGAIIGIDVDIAAALADELGLKLELVDVGTNAEQAFSSNDVDIVMGVGSDAKNCWVSKPYLSSSVVLFAAEEGKSVPKPTDVFTVAAQASSMSAVEVTNRLGQDHLEATSDIQTAFDQLKSGSVNYVATDSTIGSYVAHSAGMDIYPVALLGDQTGHCIGVSTTAAGLQDAITNALKTLSDGGVLAVIDQKWLGNQMDLSSLTLIEPIPEPEPAAEGENAEDEGGDDASTSGSSSTGASSRSSSASNSND